MDPEDDFDENLIKEREDPLILREKVRQLEEDKVRLQEENAKLEKIAEHDPLTGLLNRRGFHNALKRITAGVERSQPHSNEKTKPNIGVACIDLDHFGKTNNTFGHGIGDLVLKEFSKILQQSARRGTDIIARTGGEEITIAIIESADNTLEHTLKSAIYVAAKIQNLLMDYENKPETALGQIAAAGKIQTTSVGIAVGSGLEQLEQINKQADSALYAAKHQGRNKVAVFTGKGDIRIVDTVEPDLEGNPRNITFSSK